MTGDIKILAEFAEINRRVDRSGMAARRERPVPSAQRPMFRREVIAPGVVIGGGFWLALFTVTGGALMSAGYLTDSYSDGWFGLFLYCTAAGSAMFTYVAWKQLPEYRRLQTVTKDVIVPPRQPVQDTGRGRLITQTGPRAKAVTRLKWQPGWRTILARRTHDSEGNWTGGEHPIRAHFEKQDHGAGGLAQYQLRTRRRQGVRGLARHGLA